MMRWARHTASVAVCITSWTMTGGSSFLLKSPPLFVKRRNDTLLLVATAGTGSGKSGSRMRMINSIFIVPFFVSECAGEGAFIYARVFGNNDGFQNTTLGVIQCKNVQTWRQIGWTREVCIILFNPLRDNPRFYKVLAKAKQTWCGKHI